MFDSDGRPLIRGDKVKRLSEYCKGLFVEHREYTVENILPGGEHITIKEMHPRSKPFISERFVKIDKSPLAREQSDIETMGYRYK